MMTYILSGVLALIIGYTWYLSTKLFINTRGSRLYSNVSFVGIVGMLPFCIQILRTYNESFKLELINSALFPIFILMIYYLWRTTYNQINKNSFHSLFLVLVLLSLFCGLLSGMGFLEKNVILSQFFSYHGLDFILLFILILKYFEFSKMNSTQELNFIPLLLTIYGLSKIIYLLSYGDRLLVFSIVQAFSVLFIIIFYTKDYKRSFYY